MNKIKKWIKDIFLEVYVLTIWYKEGNEFETKITKRVYNMKKIKKATAKHVIGIKSDGNMLEIKTVEPFDYQIEKIH
jgi:hypothetical protein